MIHSNLSRGQVVGGRWTWYKEAALENTMARCLGTFGGARVPCREGMASWGPKELLALKSGPPPFPSTISGERVEGSLCWVRRSPHNTDSPAALDSKICRSLTVLNPQHHTT